MIHSSRSILDVMSIGEFYRIKKTNFYFQWETIRNYYLKSCRFALCDFLLGIASLFFNPYRICRKRGLVYGETPLVSLHQIATISHLSPNDCWLELGCGRGKGCFWVSQFIGCRTIGIDQVTLFIRLSQT